MARPSINSASIRIRFDKSQHEFSEQSPPVKIRYLLLKRLDFTALIHVPAQTRQVSGAT